MKKYSNIVLNIPHASKKMLWDGWDNKEILKSLIRRWTDWKTDNLFVPSSMTKVNAVICPYNRFTVDVERLTDDPLNEIGQGIIYTKYEECNRNVNNALNFILQQEYWHHISKIKNLLKENSLLIDCHSFPSDLSDVDVCIGFNNDWSTPNDETLYQIKSIFENNGFRTEYNEPYSNSLSPETGFKYESLMIEVNKRVYLDEDTLKFNKESNCLKKTIREIYKELI